MSKRSKSKRAVHDGADRIEKENRQMSDEEKMKQKQRQEDATLGGV